MRMCGALAQLLGYCPGSIVAVLVTFMEGMLAAAASGHKGRPGPIGAIFSRLGGAGCWGLSGVTGSGCCVTLGVAQAGTEGEGTQHLAQSRGLEPTSLWPHRSLGGLGGNCICCGHRRY